MNEPIRGFDSFIKARDGFLHAYFLVPEFHPFMERHLDEILNAMNKSKDKKIIYGYIKFDQQKLMGGKDDETFINILEKEWKKDYCESDSSIE